MSAAVLTPTDALVRAEQRLVPMVERGAPHDLVLAVFAAWEREYAAAVQRTATQPALVAVPDDLAALVDATGDEPLVAPPLLANATAEHERRDARRGASGFTYEAWGAAR